MYRLTRNYSIASLIGIAIVAIVLGDFYWSGAYKALKAHETKANAAISQALANTIWPRYSDFIKAASDIPVSELVTHPEIENLRQEVLQKMRGLRVTKVKIYDLGGLTVFSTEAKQIGEDKTGNAGYQRALGGEIASEITYRDQFSAFEEIIEDRNVLSSYIPYRKNADSPIEGVFELYSDVTPFINEIESTQFRVLGVVTALLFLLYVFLLIIVRQADRLILNYRAEEQAEQQDELRRLYYYDTVTNLPNRSGFMMLLDRAVNEAKQNKTLLGLVSIDLDRFKVVNDSLGHEIGNRVLAETASRLHSCMSKDNSVCRISGDEFTIILDDIDSVDQAAIVAERLLKELVSPICVDERDIVITPSIGIALFPSDTRIAEHLVENASAAMKKAKEMGGNRFALYTEEFNSHALERLETEVGLRRALSNDELVLFYQPRVSSGDGKVVGMEALLRWQSPERGLVPPLDIIYILEEIGLIVQVGEMVIYEACKQCKSWHDLGHDNLRVSVNLSTKQFGHASLIKCVRKALDDSGLPPEFLEIEITESVLAQDTDQATGILKELREIGVYLSIDDFGTGYSSLNYLMHFPIHYLKIDRSFIRDVTTNQNHEKITMAIIAMAKSLNLETVAEGVETEEQLALIRAMGCNQIQGFFYSKPVPADLFTDVVDEINTKIYRQDQTTSVQPCSMSVKKL